MKSLGIRSTHKIKMLTRLFKERRELTATDFICSNGNQYLGELERRGFVTRVKRERGIKFAYIEDSQKPKVAKYLKSFGVLVDNQDEVQESRN